SLLKITSRQRYLGIGCLCDGFKWYVGPLFPVKIAFTQTTRRGTFIPPRDMQPSKGHATQRGTYNPARDTHQSEGGPGKGHLSFAWDIHHSEGHLSVAWGIHLSERNLYQSSAIICCEICAFTLSLR
ncbi:hypothetical protein C0J52_15838, partial [Blattella germanica]